MQTFSLVVFSQVGTSQCCLGPWCQLTVSVAQLVTACRQPLQGPNPAQVRVFSASGDGSRGVMLPEPHDLEWGSQLPDQVELDESAAAEQLRQGRPLQIFVYNGDSECLRHFLILPLPESSNWLPSNTAGLSNLAT